MVMGWGISGEFIVGKWGVGLPVLRRTLVVRRTMYYTTVGSSSIEVAPVAPTLLVLVDR